MIKSLIASLILLMCGGCGYRFQGEGSDQVIASISVPYVKGDIDGLLTEELIRTLVETGRFDYTSSGGEWTLLVSVIGDGDERIGYRYDRNPTTGKRRDNIVGTENRRTLICEMKLIDTASEEIILGPLVIKGQSEYDYVDSNSIYDLVTFTPQGPQTVIEVSLGQLDSIEGAHDDATVVAFRSLAQKIVDGLIMGCD
ncbi:MAG: hypothetical protein JSS61_02465 [Verrucomicrobia bacterium]|nr:hypothetical protein [Verrucomicrobiota bacterium]